MADPTPRDGFTFPGPVPKEALDYIRAKGWKVGFSHLDVFREEHAHYFTVAKAMKYDVLAAIRSEVDKALAEGRTLQQFRRDLEPTLQKLGWWGVKEEADPATGEIRPVQLGSPYRLKVIYDTNLRTSRAAGQEERMQRTKAALPYALYSLGPSAEHRPEHVAWHGVLLPIDDPWWDTHTPQLGYGCKCRKRQVGEREAARLKAEGVLDPTAPPKLNPETGLPTGKREKRYTPVQTEAPPIRYREWVNKRTGEVLQVPVGIDPGFDVNPARAARQLPARLVGEKLASWEAALGATAYTEMGPVVRQLVADSYRSWLSGVLRGGVTRQGAALVGAMAPADVVFLERLGKTPASAGIVVHDRLIVGKKAARHEAAGDALSADEWARLPEAVADPEAVLYDTDTGSLIYVMPSAGDPRRTKVVVAPEFWDKNLKVGINSVRTVFKVGANALTNRRRYEVVRGEIR